MTYIIHIEKCFNFKVIKSYKYCEVSIHRCMANVDPIFTTQSIALYSRQRWEKLLELLLEWFSVSIRSQAGQNKKSLLMLTSNTPTLSCQFLKKNMDSNITSKSLLKRKLSRVFLKTYIQRYGICRQAMWQSNC